jgi:hypothetical protein
MLPLLCCRRLDGDRHRLREGRLDLIALRDLLELLGIGNAELDRALRSFEGDRLLGRVDSDDIGDNRDLAAACAGRQVARLGTCDGRLSCVGRRDRRLS